MNREERKIQLFWLSWQSLMWCHRDASTMEDGDIKWLIWGQSGKGQTNCAR